MKSFGISGVFGHPWSTVIATVYAVIIAGLVQQNILSAAQAAEISTVVTFLIGLFFKGSNPPPSVGP